MSSFLCGVPVDVATAVWVRISGALMDLAPCCVGTKAIFVSLDSRQTRLQNVSYLFQKKRLQNIWILNHLETGMDKTNYRPMAHCKTEKK